MLGLLARNECLTARFLQQDLRLVDFGLRRFRLREGHARRALESAGMSFLEGFNAAVSHRGHDRMVSAIERLDPPLRGFAYEGAGMACTLLDIMSCVGGRNMRELLSGSGAAYRHLIHVGAGWAFAKLRLRPAMVPAAAPDDPLLSWLAWDGYGFQRGFFHADKVIGGQRVEWRLTPDQHAIRDQGLGRCLWFHECADPEGVVLRINEFPSFRRGDLWSGVGLAATYAGGAEPGELELLARSAGEHRAHVAQGCAFACEARRVSGIVPRHTEVAANLLAGVSSEVAGEWANSSLAMLGRLDGTSAQYQRWRSGIRRLWSEQAEVCHT